MPNATRGEPGLGDPYYPEAGNSGYDVAKYQIAVSWDPAKTTLSGTTVISARATQRLQSFYLDFGLPVSEVRVNGSPATFDQQGGIAAGGRARGRDRHRRRVRGGGDYAGNPGDV